MGLVAHGGDGSPTLAAGTEEAIPPTGSPKRTDREAMPPPLTISRHAAREIIRGWARAF